jgi:hypothetical protein
MPSGRDLQSCRDELEVSILLMRCVRVPESLIQGQCHIAYPGRLCVPSATQPRCSIPSCHDRTHSQVFPWIHVNIFNSSLIHWFRRAVSPSCQDVVILPTCGSPYGSFASSSREGLARSFSPIVVLDYINQPSLRRRPLHRVQMSAGSRVPRRTSHDMASSKILVVVELPTTDTLLRDEVWLSMKLAHVRG